VSKIIDFHVHIDESEDASAGGVPVKMGRKEILAGMEEAGIDVSVLLVMAQGGEIQKTREQNDWLASVCLEEPRFVGFGSVHPGDGSAALEEMDRCIKQLGLKGIKLHPDVQKFDCGDPALVDVFKRAAKLDVPVTIDTYSPFDGQQPAKLLQAVLESPETKICLAHVGGFRFAEFGFYGLLKQRTPFDLNVYFDLSASCEWFYNTPFQEPFCWITQQLGPDNLLFGSDFPVRGPRVGSEFPLTPVKDILEMVRNFGYPEEWIPKILGGNAARLLCLEASTLVEEGGG